MFARIYTGIFVSVLLAALVNFGLYLWSHQTRWPQYEEDALGGTMRLVAESLAQQSPERAARYLEIVARLLGADTASIETAALDPRLLADLADKKPVELAGDTTSVRWCLPHPPADVDETGSAIPDSCTELRFAALSEQQYRAFSLLVVAELSKGKDARSIETLRDYTPYPLQLVNRSQPQLDRQQLSRLANNSVVVAADYQRSNSFTVFAPLNATEQLVQLGPVPRFSQLPVTLVATMIALTVALMAAISYWLVRQLETRLQTIDHMVQAFGSGELAARINSDDKDQIGALARHVDAMANRIENHIEGERSLIQAVSHDFRTPLSRMRFRVEMLGNALDRDRQPELIERTDSLNRDIGELESLVNEVLEQHELGASRQLELLELQPNRLIVEVINSLTEVHPSVQIDTSLSAPDRLRANGRFFSRLLLNLADNACKHAQHSVLISTSHNGKHFQLSVEDDGSGIDEQDRARVFDTFFRADSSRNRQTGGFGLGLSIVKRIADLHQAHVELTDSRYGGAQFNVRFPLVQSA